MAVRRRKDGKPDGRSTSRARRSKESYKPRTPEALEAQRQGRLKGAKRAAELAALSQADADERWRYYSQLADVQRSIPSLEHEPAAAPADGPTASTNEKGESK